jgi:hypothetical protein
MLIKLTPWVNFINILRALFAKKSQSQTVIREKMHNLLLNEKCCWNWHLYYFQFYEWGLNQKYLDWGNFCSKGYSSFLERVFSSQFCNTLHVFQLRNGGIPKLRSVRLNNIIFICNRLGVSNTWPANIRKNEDLKWKIELFS